MSNIFRPSDIGTKYIMRMRLKYGRTDNYNFHSHSKNSWYPVGWKLNHRTIARQFSRLHYLACHSPDPVKKQWRKAYNAFMNKHFGDAGKCSVKYLNKWSCHSWL